MNGIDYRRVRRKALPALKSSHRGCNQVARTRERPPKYRLTIFCMGFRCASVKWLRNSTTPSTPVMARVERHHP